VLLNDQMAEEQAVEVLCHKWGQVRKSFGEPRRPGHGFREMDHPGDTRS
jgi:hypothetical protein